MQSNPDNKSVDVSIVSWDQRTSVVLTFISTFADTLASIPVEQRLTREHLDLEKISEVASIKAVTHGFQASTRVALTVAELKIFEQELRTLHRTLKGSAGLAPPKIQGLRLDVQINHLGHLIWTVHLWRGDPDRPYKGPRVDTADLRLTLCNDQSYLPEIIEQLVAARILMTDWEWSP